MAARSFGVSSLAWLMHSGQSHPGGCSSLANNWTLEFIASVEEIGSREWAAICGEDYPFLHYTFLHALERSGCVNGDSAWQSHHAIIRSGGRTVGILPLYRKYDSYGEYVFDWAWADAYFRHGLDYYPKLVTAIPYTPATGPRLCLAAGIEREKAWSFLLQGIREEVERLGASSWHCLFPFADESHTLQELGASQRLGCQYHWLNENYQSFDEFLSTFSSRKRKNLNKERHRVAQQGIRLTRKRGSEISGEEWRQFYFFYQLTYLKRSGRKGYLNEDFFMMLAAGMPEQILMVLAHHEDELIAAALFFEDADTLYGRYWGCREEFDFLHFEACYYQGIDYAIERGLQRFDPGAQGEHKIQRGFMPLLTWSNHWIALPPFREAIDGFLREEAPAVQAYLDDAKSLLPFKREG